MAEQDDNIFGTGGNPFGADANPFGEAPRRGGKKRWQTDDFDAEPGSRRNSKEYDRKYNPQGENEFSNQPENQTQLRSSQWLFTRDKYLKAQSDDPMLRVRFRQHGGPFVLPKQNTFAAHWQLVREGDKVNIHFDPAMYPHFDGVIAKKAHRPELFDPKHPDYAKYEVLRDNLAVLRNHIMSTYMSDGSFDPEDMKFLPNLDEISTEIGRALRADAGNIRRIAAPTLSAEWLNIEGEGAAHAYRFLVDQQAPDNLPGRVSATFRELFKQPRREWDLPPLAKSPFSEEGLSALPVKDELCHCAKEQLSERAIDLLGQQKPTPGLSAQAMLSEKRALSVEVARHGRIIYDWLKNLKFSEKPLEEALASGNPGSTEEADRIAATVALYKKMRAEAVEADPAFAQQAEVMAADEVAAALSHSLEMKAVLEKPKDLASTMQISTDITQQPEKWNELKGDTVDRLMQTLKGGLEQAFSAVEQQQEQAMDASEELAEQALEAATQQIASRKKKKKARASTTAAKQRRQDRDLRADDRAAGQGIHQEPIVVRRERTTSSMRSMGLDAAEAAATLAPSVKTGSKSAMKPLSPEAEALIKATGATLRGAHHNGTSLAAAQGVEVNAGDKIAPDDQPFSVRQTQTRERDQQNGKQL